MRSSHRSRPAASASCWRLRVALYAGSNGAGAVMTALNIAYEEEEKRSLLRFYGIAFTITVAAVLLALVALAAMACGRDRSNSCCRRLRAAAVGLGKLGLYSADGSVGRRGGGDALPLRPIARGARWQWLTPGSLFTAVVWLLLAIGFSFYVTRLTDYNATYGSIAAIVMLLTWMYLSAYVFLFGAELNAELEHQTAKDSTTGHAAAARRARRMGRPTMSPE